MRPVKGMFCTINVGSDSYAGTIVAVSDSGKTFTYTFDYDFKRQSKARFVRGQWRTGKTYTIDLGVHKPYLDPSF